MFALLRDNEVEDRFDVAKETDPIPVAGEKEELEYLDTPPSREEAFEQFKKERGKEVNRVLMENKGTNSLGITCNTVEREIFAA